MRSAGINTARKYGVTSQAVNDAKQKMFDAERDLAIAQNMEKRDWNNLSTDEQLKVAAAYRRTKGLSADAELSASQVEEMKNTGATMYASEMNSAYGKAKSNYEKASKFADSHRVSTSFEEEHRPSIKESASGKFRAVRTGWDAVKGGPAGIKNAVSNRMEENRGEHQGLGDRIAGNNKWSSGGNNGQGHNRYNDNPDRNQDTPSAGPR